MRLRLRSGFVGCRAVRASDAGSPAAAHRLSSDARWSADALGLALADLIVAHLVPPARR
ncbi:MAG: hypothetical protein ACRDYA_09190 [Egibacteraceae bacterium]